MRDIFRCYCFTIFMVVVTADINSHTIESPKITNWGSWGELESCPVGMFVTGMQLKVERAEGWKDDTGLNGIRLYCSRLGQAVDIYEEESPVISSSVGPFGEWKSVFRCGESGLNPKTSAVVGFQLRVETEKGIQDDTSSNNFRVFCDNVAEKGRQIILEGDGTGWGEWTDAQFCRKGYALCGIVTQIDEGHEHGYDDTGLNNVRAECCKIRLYDINYHDYKESRESDDDVMFPDPQESARKFNQILLQKSRSAVPSYKPHSTTPGPKEVESITEAFRYTNTDLTYGKLFVTGDVSSKAEIYEEMPAPPIATPEVVQAVEAHDIPDDYSSSVYSSTSVPKSLNSSNETEQITESDATLNDHISNDLLIASSGVGGRSMVTIMIIIIAAIF